MLTVCGFIESENWMYARHLNDDSFCSHTSSGGICDQHYYDRSHVNEHVKEEVVKKEPVYARKGVHSEKTNYSDSESFGVVAAWETKKDIVKAERCQHILDKHIPDLAGQDAFFVWFRGATKGKQEEVRRDLMTQCYIEAAGIKRRKQRQ